MVIKSKDQLASIIFVILCTQIIMLTTSALRDYEYSISV